MQSSSMTLILFGLISAGLAAQQQPASLRPGPVYDPPAGEYWLLETEDKAASLYVFETGQGEPVVVVHGGFGADHTYLLDVSEGLRDRFRFVFYDQRGSARSFCRAESISIEKHVEDLETLRKALGVDKMNLLSHSAGTMLALRYLQRYPRSVKNLVLAGALDPKNGAKFFGAEERKLFGQKQQEYDRFLARPEIQAEIDNAGLGADDLSLKQQAHLRHLRMAAANIYKIERWRSVRFFMVNAEAAQATSQSIDWEYDWSELLAGHPYPVSVINGEFDYVVGPRNSPIWRKLISSGEAPKVRLTVLKNAGHAAWVDDPEGFRNALLKALASNE